MSEAETAHEALSMGERLQEALAFKTVFTLNIAGREIPITETVVISWVAMALIIVVALLATRRLREIPGRFQSFVEAIVEFKTSFCEQYMGHHAKIFSDYIGTLFLFLLVMNLLPLVSPIGGFGFEPAFTIKPPARDINVPAALAILTITIVIVSGIIAKGPIGWVKRLFQPVAFMFPFNLLEYAIKPISLSLRLFGNILGAFIIMRLIEAVAPVGIPPVVALYFDIFDGLLQAAVFTFLTTLYITEAVE